MRVNNECIFFENLFIRNENTKKIHSNELIMSVFFLKTYL